MASVTQPVPGQEALLVEFPGHIQDPDKALARLGGIEAVAGVASGRAQFLGFQFRPGDPLAHPLQGDRRPAKGLLLRISRKAATGAGATLCHTACCCSMEGFRTSDTCTCAGMRMWPVHVSLFVHPEMGVQHFDIV